MYLLGTQELTDLFSRDPARPIIAWLRETQPADNQLFVSVISLGILAHQIEDLDPGSRNHWRRLYAEGRRSLADKGSIIDVDMAIVDQWATSLRGLDLTEEDGLTGDRFEMGEDSRLVIATAITRGYSLVTRITPAIEVIAEQTTLTIVEP
jgi:predicted nucleic acid-binding protein